MPKQTHIYKDLDAVIEYTKEKRVFPRACARSYYSKINADSSSSNLFLRSVPNVLNLLLEGSILDKRWKVDISLFLLEMTLRFLPGR